MSEANFLTGKLQSFAGSNRFSTNEVTVDQKASKEDVQNLEKRVAAIEEKDRLDSDSEELAKKLEAKLREQQEIIERNTVKKLEEAKKKEEKNTDKTGSAFTEAMKELQEREGRRNSLVIQNLKESAEVNPEARKLDDAEKIEKILSDQLKLNIDFQKDQKDQPMVYRLGKKNNTNSRSVKIVLNPQDAQLVLNNAKYLNSIPDADIKKMIIKPDLTPMQREEELKLVKEKNEKNKEAKEKNQPQNWIIQRWKVVRRKVSEQIQKADAQTSNSSLSEEFRDASQ